MTFNDDEPIIASPDVSEEAKPAPFIEGRIQRTLINKNEAPLEQTNFKVLLELTGVGSGKDRSGVDLVMVLDVSGSMKGEKIEKLKTAVQFVIKKLSPIDRLSVVTFAAESKRLCPLRQITEKSQVEIENLVKGLAADGSTNITAGLQTGLQVLNDRTLSNGRVVGIMLLSDGQQNAGGDAAQVLVGNVPVCTFGFGIDHDPKVLKAIADNSMGGTFSDVQNQNNLSIAFSQCLAGLLTVVVQDLKVIITEIEDKYTIDKVSAGNYPQSKDARSVTISFGDLYEKEVRKIVVDLLLPEVPSRMPGVDVLKNTYTYSTGGKQFDSSPIFATITRTGTSEEQEKEEVQMEDNRLRTAQKIKEARVMADQNKLEDAKDLLDEAQNSLEDESIPLIRMLKSELKQLFDLMKTQQMYEKQGRPFALSSETSHDRQRFAARGNVDKLRLFATPRMDEYLEQAKSFDEDPSKPLPTVEDDVKKELAADPLAPIVGPLSYYLQVAIQALQSLEKIINKSR